jgi:hypothetical protein
MKVILFRATWQVESDAGVIYAQGPIPYRFNPALHEALFRSQHCPSAKEVLTIMKPHMPDDMYKDFANPFFPSPEDPDNEAPVRRKR